MKRTIFLCQRLCNDAGTSNNQVEAQMYMQMAHSWNQLNTINGNLQVPTHTLLMAIYRYLLIHY